MVIWKTNQYLISWRVIRFNFTASVPFLNISRERDDSGRPLFFPAGDTFFNFFFFPSFQVSGETSERGDSALMSGLPSPAFCLSLCGPIVNCW